MIPQHITVGTKSHDVILQDLGITGKQSSRWQLEATVTEEVFERYSHPKSLLQRNNGWKGNSHKAVDP